MRRVTFTAPELGISCQPKLTAATTVLLHQGEGWQNVQRHWNISLTDWQGAPAYELQIPCIFDQLTFNWATRTSMTSVEKEIRYMERMTELLPNKPRPPIISVDAGGAIPHDKTNAPNRSWVIAPLTMGDYIISKQGFRVRQEFTVALWDYRPESILQGAQRLPDRPVPRTYKVVSGDNLLKIAAYFYGDQARWHDIASLNKITDPMHLKVGTTLKMPPATPTSTKAAS